jgi:hypothetical protein
LIGTTFLAVVGIHFLPLQRYESLDSHQRERLLVLQVEVR